MPSVPSSNSAFEGGVSMLPLDAGDAGIILTSLQEGAEAAATPAPIGSAAALDISSIVKSGSVPSLAAGSTPVSAGEFPASTGVLIPGASVLKADMETVNNTFNPFVDEAKISPAQAVPATKINAGSQPSSNGKIVK